jgi:hypothetical protein
MITEVSPATPEVPIVKLAVVAFAATVTLAGTVAAEVLLLLRLTVVPPAAAGPVRVTVPVDEAPPGTEEGFTLRAFSSGDVTVRPPVWVELP